MVLTRSEGVDLTSGAGLAARFDGVEGVIDVTSIETPEAQGPRASSARSPATCSKAEVEAGAGHHLALSIVGIDDVPSGYYQGKLLQERLVVEGGCRGRILRATQFHEFAEQALGYVRVGPFVDRAADGGPAGRRGRVAESLVDLAEAGPSGRCCPTSPAPSGSSWSSSPAGSPAHAASAGASSP